MSTREFKQMLLMSDVFSAQYFSVLDRPLSEVVDAVFRLSEGVQLQKVIKMSHKLL